MEYTTLHIYDFDGTLYNSPVPNRALWDRNTFGKLQSPNSASGYGWYQNPITLEEKYAKVDRFNESIVESVKLSIAMGAYVVLLTGRHLKHRQNINRLLDAKNLQFDRVLLKVGETDRTFDFKAAMIKSLLVEYPTVNKITLWDDRERHMPKFIEFLKDLSTKVQLDWVFNKVDIAPTYLDVVDEREIVSNLMEKSSS